MDEMLLLLQPESAIFQHEWAPENITTAFFKCNRWLVEETMDLVNCPYHYFCETTYPGNYPPIVGLFVVFFTAASFFSTIAFTVIILTSRFNESVQLRQQLGRRYLLPSGPLSLPVILLVLAKGYRINAMLLPLSDMGPLLLQLVHVSAIGFENSAYRTLRYALFEASTASGILHASVYLDSIILPHYTGLDALLTSTFSGECQSCVCRREALVVGGRLVSYRGWSLTTFSVVGTLFSRIACGLFVEEKLSILVKFALEGSAWILISSDSVYLMLISPVGGFLARAAHGALCVLIFLLVLRKTVYNLLPCLAGALSKIQNKNDLSHNNV